MTDRVLIRVEHLVKHFGKLKVLNDISEEIREGEVVSIIGPSGGGKSTFLRCLNLLEKPTSGKVFFDDVEITGKHVDIDKHRQKMGMVFQHFNVFPHLSVIDNITLAPVLEKKIPKGTAEAKAMELLRQVGLQDNANEFKDWRLFELWLWNRKLSSLTNLPALWILKWLRMFWM